MKFKLIQCLPVAISNLPPQISEVQTTFTKIDTNIGNIW